MSSSALLKTRMKAFEFLAWADAQSQGRFELVGGEVVAMAPERARHNLVKLAVARALADAVKAARLPCTVFTDGMAVVINEDTVREPDAAVQCGSGQDLNAMAIDAPLIVVEVTSPSSERDDTGAKLVEYFSVASIRHYLIVRPEQNAVVHHRKDESGEIHTRIANEGDIMLAPPGLTVAVARLLAHD